MQCPYCQTENRDDRDRCYHCDKDLSMLRLIVNKAKHHYNRGLELAERGHDEDAIQELRNAIELDQSMINAHVVLGSLYARREQFDQAKECWSQAIEQDNRYSKAHEYLSKAETVKFTFPTIKRLQIVAWASGLLFVVCFGVMIYALIPEPQPATVEEILADVPAGEFRKSDIRRQLSKITMNEAMPAKIQEMAGNINRMVDTNVRNWMEMTERALDGEAPDLALLMMERLAWIEIDDADTRTKLTQLHERAVAQLSENVYAASRHYQSGRIDYEEFERTSKRFLDRFAETAEGQDIEELTGRVRKQHLEQTLIAAQTLIMTDPPAQALQTANKLIAQYPEMSDSVNRLVDQRLATEAETALAHIAGMIHEGRFGDARARMGELKLIFESAGRTPPSARLAELDTRIEELQAGRSLEAAHAAYAAEEFEEFLKITSNLDQITNDELEKSKLREMRKEILVRRAAAEAKWFRDLDWRFLEMVISPEEAAHAIEVFRPVIEHLPANEKYMHTAIMFYTACAYVRLDQTAAAASLIAELESLEGVSYPRYVRDYVASLKEKYPAVTTGGGEAAAAGTGADGPIELEIMEKDSPTTPTE